MSQGNIPDLPDGVFEEKESLKPCRGVILIGSFGRVAIDLANIIESFKDNEAIKLQEANFPIAKKPHQNKHYKRHCLRSKW